MEFLQNNWFWLLLILLFVGMHGFGMGCCGARRGRRAGRKGEEATEEKEKSCH